MGENKFDIFDEVKFAKMEIKNEERTEVERRTEFGRRLKKIREEKGFTQRDLSDVINRTHDTISNYERGLRYPYKQELENICELFNVDLDYFFPDKRYPQLISISNKKKYTKKVSRRSSPVITRTMEELGIASKPTKKLYSTANRDPLPDELGITYDVEDELKEMGIDPDSSVENDRPIEPNGEDKQTIKVLQSDHNHNIKRKITITIGKEVSINVEEY